MASIRLPGCPREMLMRQEDASSERPTGCVACAIQWAVAARPQPDFRLRISSYSLTSESHNYGVVINVMTTWL